MSAPSSLPHPLCLWSSAASVGCSPTSTGIWGLCARVVLAGGCCGQLLSGLEERRGAVLAAALNHWLCLAHSCPSGAVLAAAGPELPGRQVLRARQGRQQAWGLLCSLCPGESLLWARILLRSRMLKPTNIKAACFSAQGSQWGWELGAGHAPRQSHTILCLAGESGKHARHPEHLPCHGHRGGCGSGVE